MVKIVKQTEININDLRKKGSVILLSLTKTQNSDEYMLYAQEGLIFTTNDHRVYFNYPEDHSKCNYPEIRKEIAIFFDKFIELCKKYDYVYYPNAMIEYDEFGKKQKCDLITVLNMPVVNKKDIVLEHITVKINEMITKLEKNE